MHNYLLPQRQQRQPLTSVENLHPLQPSDKKINTDNFRKKTLLKLEDSFSIANEDDDELDSVFAAISKIVVENVSINQPSVAESILKLLRKAKNVKDRKDENRLSRNIISLNYQPVEDTKITEEVKAFSVGPSSARKRRASISNNVTSSLPSFTPSEIINVGKTNAEFIESDFISSDRIPSSSVENIVVNEKESSKNTSDRYEETSCSPPVEILEGMEDGIMHWNISDDSDNFLHSVTNRKAEEIDCNSMSVKINSKPKRNMKRKEKKKITTCKTTRRRSCLPTLAEFHVHTTEEDQTGGDKIIKEDTGFQTEPISPQQPETVHEVDFHLASNDACVKQISARQTRASIDSFPPSNLSEDLPHLSYRESLLEVMIESDSLSSGLIHWSSVHENNFPVEILPTETKREGKLPESADNLNQDEDVMISSLAFEADEDFSYNDVGPGLLHWDTSLHSAQQSLDIDISQSDSCSQSDSSKATRNARDKKKEKARKKPIGGKTTRRTSCLPPIGETDSHLNAGEDIAVETKINDSILSSRFACASVDEDTFLGGILHWECSSEVGERTFNVAPPPPEHNYPVYPTPVDSSKEIMPAIDDADADVMKMLMELEDLKSFPISAVSDIKVSASESRGRSRRRASLSAESFIKTLTNASHRGSPQATATLASLSAATAADLIAEGDSDPPPIMARNKRQKKTKLLENVVVNLPPPSVSVEQDLNVNQFPQVNQLLPSHSETDNIAVPSTTAPESSTNSIERMVGVRLLSISSDLLVRLEMESDVVARAESIINNAKLPSNSFALVSESSLLCIVVVALLANDDCTQVESLVGNIRIFCEIPMTEEKIIQYSSIEKAFQSVNSNGLTLSQSQSSASVNKGPIEKKKKKTVRFNAVDGSAIDPPNDRRPLSWISLLLGAKKMHMLSVVVGNFLCKSNNATFSNKHDLSLLCAVLLFLSSGKNADTVVRHTSKQRSSSGSLSFVSGAELQTVATFLLNEIILQSMHRSSSLAAENNNLLLLNPSLRVRSSWMLSAVVRYQLRWCLDLPPPCISVPSATSRDGSAATEDVYSSYRSPLHHRIEILQPLTEEALRAKPAYSVDEIIASLNFSSGARSQKATAFLNTVKILFCAQPFANLSFLFAEALRQVSAMLSLICSSSSCGGDAPLSLLRELAPLDCLCQLRANSAAVASALTGFIKAVDKDCRFEVCQVIYFFSIY